MIGNVSFQHSLQHLEFINFLLREKALAEEALNRFGITRRKPVEIRFVRMSEALMDSLDYVSKLSREPGHIERLVQDGRQQGRAFLAELS